VFRRRFCISNELWAYIDSGDLEIALREPECLATGPATDIEERLSRTEVSIAEQYLGFMQSKRSGAGVRIVPGRKRVGPYSVSVHLIGTRPKP